MTTTDTIQSHETELTPRRGPRRYGAIVTGALLMVVGGLWLLDVAELIDLRTAIVLPAVLAVIGLALIVGAFDGPHPGLVVAGFFVAVAGIAVAAAPPDAFHGGIGQRTIVVTDQANLAPTYDVGMGGLELDLSGLTMTESAVVDATIGVGNLTVILPPDVPVEISASAGAGQVDLFGQVEEGISVSRVYTGEDLDTAEVTLTLDLDVAAGNIEVDE